MPIKHFSSLVVCFGFVASASAATQTYLSDTNLPAGSTDIPQFRFSVAMRGDEALVAAPKQMGMLLGSIFLYRQGASGSWMEETTFGYPQVAHDYGSYVGCNGIAVDGDTVAVGLPGADSSVGNVQIFERRDTVGWILSQTLSAPSPSSFESFGCSVALSGSSLIVGAPGHAGAGGAYVFVNDRRGWTLQSTLSPGGLASGDSAGFAVAIDGDVAVLGAPHSSSDKGAAYVFTRSGSAWSLTHDLTAYDGTAGEQFGASVAVSNSTVVAGAPGWALGNGAIYSFVDGTLEQRWHPSGTTKYFGSSVAISDDRVIAGAIGDAAAYAFTRSGDFWYQRATFSDVSTSKLGAAVAISGSTAILGAPAADSIATPVDHAYIVHDDDIFFNGFE